MKNDQNLPKVVVKFLHWIWCLIGDLIPLEVKTSKRASVSASEENENKPEEKTRWISSFWQEYVLENIPLAVTFLALGVLLILYSLGALRVIPAEDYAEQSAPVDISVVPENVVSASESQDSTTVKESIKLRQEESPIIAPTNDCYVTLLTKMKVIVLSKTVQCPDREYLGVKQELSCYAEIDERSLSGMECRLPKDWPSNKEYLMPYKGVIHPLNNKLSKADPESLKLVISLGLLAFLLSCWVGFFLWNLHQKRRVAIAHGNLELNILRT